MVVTKLSVELLMCFLHWVKCIGVGVFYLIFFVLLPIYSARHCFAGAGGGYEDCNASYITVYIARNTLSIPSVLFILYCDLPVC